MATKAVEAKFALCLPFLLAASPCDSLAPRETRLTEENVIHYAGDRIKVACGILDFMDFFTPNDSFPYGPAAMQQFLQSRNRKIAEIIHALRVAVTGKSVGLGMFETLEILGKERVLRRIDRTFTEPVA